MAIFKPGQKFRYHRLLSRAGGKRELVATLSLTAMVDMFTVLVIFLLQNYSSTGEVIYLPKDVALPKAEEIKELKPSVVVTISNKEVLLDRDVIVTFEQVHNQEEWLIVPLQEKIKQALEVAKQKFEAELANKLREVVKQPVTDQVEQEVMPWSKVTVQADKGIDFLTVKKVMFTVTEAGANVINFAVLKRTSEE